MLNGRQPKSMLRTQWVFSGLQLAETGFIMIYPYLSKKIDGKSGKPPKFEKSIGDWFTKEIERGLR